MKEQMQKPDIQFPIGTILEDEKMIMKILDFREVQLAHSYKVEVLKWKVEPPDYVKPYVDMKTPWIIVSAESIPKMKVLQ